MNTRLYVGNLPYTVDEEQLRELFSQVGEVADVAVIMDRETGRSKGFGFVTMASADDIARAINQFNGYSLSNRSLTVNEARPREDRPGAPRGGSGNGGGPSRRPRY